MLIKLDYSKRISILFTLLSCILAILIPMFTVTVIVNNYSLPPSLLPFYQWHGFQMIFCFFITIYIGYIISISDKRNKDKLYASILFILWINEQIAIHMYANKLLLMLSSGILSLTVLYYSYLSFDEKLNRTFFCITSFIFLGLKSVYLFSAISKSTFNLKNEVLILSIWILILTSSTIIKKTHLGLTLNLIKSSNKSLLGRVLFFLSLIFLLLIPTTLLVKNKHYFFMVYFCAGLFNLQYLRNIKAKELSKRPTLSIIGLSYFVMFSSLIVNSFSLYFQSFSYTKATLHLSLTGGVTLFAFYYMIMIIDRSSFNVEKKNKSILFMCMCIFIGFLIRVIVPIYDLNLFNKSLHYSMGMWTLAFLVFFIKYLPIAFKKRIN